MKIVILMKKNKILTPEVKIIKIYWRVKIHFLFMIIRIINEF